MPIEFILDLILIVKIVQRSNMTIGSLMVSNAYYVRTPPAINVNNGMNVMDVKMNTNYFPMLLRPLFNPLIAEDAILVFN